MGLAADAKPITRVHKCDALGHSSESSFMSWLVDVTTAMKDSGNNVAACERLLVHLRSGNAESTEFHIVAQAINMPGEGQPAEMLVPWLVVACPLFTKVVCWQLLILHTSAMQTAILVLRPSLGKISHALQSNACQAERISLALSSRI